VAAPIIYTSPVLPEWIDYNGHLRDSYYVVALSLASDSFLDRIGVDEAYRKRTACTIYTLELHIHYLHEVKFGQTLEVRARVLGHDAKRVHLALDCYVAGRAEPVALSDMMLLHVQQGEKPGSAPFPPAVLAAIAQIEAETASLPPRALGSRAIALPPPRK
jgi:acyl-CoA thioester hydrolase